jgi:hypothetical protein
LRLCADENRNAKDNAAQAQDQGPFAMRKESHRNVQRRGHGLVGSGGRLTVRWRTGSPGRNLS